MSDFGYSLAPAREAAAAKRRHDLSDDDLEEQRLFQSESKHKHAMYLASYHDYSQVSESRKKKTKKRKKSPRRSIKISPEKEKRYAELSRKRKKETEEEERPKKVTTQQTFERLSANSIEKKDRVTTQVNEFKKKEHEMFGSASPKCNSKSNQLADRKMLKELDRVFDQSEEELTRSQLASKLCQLGMLDERQKLESQPLLKEKLEEWTVQGEDDVPKYDKSKVKTSLTESILAPSPSKFDSLVCISIIASLTKPQTDTPEEIRRKKSRMSREAIERLSTAKHKTPKRPWKRVRDPIYFGYREPPPPPTMSPKSVELLETLEDAKIPFVERDELMARRRKADFKRAVRKQIRESRELAMTATPKAQKPPQNTDMPPAERAPPPTEPDPVRRPRFKQSEHPAGWDAAVNRGRIACATKRKALL